MLCKKNQNKLSECGVYYPNYSNSFQHSHLLHDVQRQNIEVAKRFKQVVRGSDTVARLGGDEFVAIIENLTDLSDMEVVAKKMLDVLSHPISLQGDNYTVGASLGIAVCPMDADDLEQLIDRADKAMYQAKKSGRNQYKLYRDLA